MKDKLKSIFFKAIRPCATSIIASILILIFIAVSTVYMLTTDYEGTWLEPIAYASFALSAVGIAYVSCVVAYGAPRFKKMLTDFMNKRAFTRKILENWGFRTIIASTVAFGMGIVNSIFNAYLGISEKSIWFGALAAYYIFLALMRSGLLIYHRKKGKYENESLVRAKKYMRCGILLLILNAALSSAIAQMIFDDRSFEYKDWLIFAFAAYAFYKVIMSVINAVKARRQDDLTIQAIREINMVDAAVSILALQTALLHTFGDGSVNISHFNTVTGIVVSLFSVGLSLIMIVRGRRIIKEIKDGKQR